MKQCGCGGTGSGRCSPATSARQGITPLRFSCEDLVADRQGAIDRIARKLDVAGPAKIDPAILRVQIQRDELNSEWRDRFLASEQGFPAIVDLRTEAGVTFGRRLRKLQRKLGLRRDLE
jgi:hypothetical protein